MKKLICLLLALIMTLSLCACGGNDTPNTDDGKNTEESSTGGNTAGEDPVPAAEPTEEEKTALRYYRSAVTALNSPDEDGDVFFDYEDFDVESEYSGVSGQEALKSFYQLLTDLEEVDKWVGTEWASDEDINWDRQAVLDSFTVIENVLLKETHTYADHLGNEGSSTDHRWTYNPDGTVNSNWSGYFIADSHPWEYKSFVSQIETNPGLVGVGNNFYVYDAEGRVEKIEDDAGGAINAVRKFTYDGDLVSSEQILYAEGREETVSYTYDSNGRVTEITTILGDVRHRMKYVFTYEYNDRGQVVTEKVVVDQEDYWNENSYEFCGESVITYTYDSNGYLSSGVCVYTRPWDSLGVHGTAETTDEWTYTCDEQGRPVSVSIACGDEKLKETGEVVWEEDMPTCNVEFEYGNYYFYNSAN